MNTLRDRGLRNIAASTTQNSKTERLMILYGPQSALLRVVTGLNRL